MTSDARTPPTIFLALANFGNISNVLRGRCIRHLAEKFSIVVLTEFIDEAVAERDGYFRNERTRYVRLPLRYRRLWDASNMVWRHAFVRGYDHLWVTQHWIYQPTLPWLVRFAERVGRILPRSFPTPAFFTRVERLIARPTAGFRALVRQERPRLLLTATPGYKYAPFEAEMIVFAKNLGIPTAAIDIGVDNPTSQAKFIRKTDWIMVWSDQMRSDVEVYHGYAPDRVFRTGSLKFDHYFTDRQEGRMKDREAFLRSNGLDPRKKLIVYATPTPGSYPPRRELMAELVRLLREGRIQGRPNLLVRLHPHDVWEPYREFVGLEGVAIERAGTQRLSDREAKGQKVEMVEADLVNLTETLMHADVLVNFASTMIMEASIFGTPTVSIGFPEDRAPLGDYEGTIEFMKASGEPVARSPEELALLVNRYLADPDRDRARYEGVVREFVCFTDGRNSARIAGAVGKILGRIGAR